ncbi:MAG TPA: carboxypeptidase-like regulatory domain-containing protein [Pyrinomonadaceae bacterium]|nr:carboxypeptidase-like regulatory domain-containing protein [Pyrinomonadaceae bacterium]HMP66584.1 carboxypeptidase-like regulatory domain-containing protein [Pyrinomonadaceae bacterium]
MVTFKITFWFPTIFCILVGLIIVPDTFSQRTLRVSGRVVDAGGDPIEGATVALVGDFHVVLNTMSSNSGWFAVERRVHDSAKVWLLIEGPRPSGYSWPEYAFSLNPLYRNTKRFSGYLLGRTESGIIRLGDVRPTVNYRGVKIALSEILGDKLPDSDASFPEILLKIKSGSVLLREANPIHSSAIRDQKIYLVIPDSPVTLEFIYFDNNEKKSIKKHY